MYNIVDSNPEHSPSAELSLTIKNFLILVPTEEREKSIALGEGGIRLHLIKERIFKIKNHIMDLTRQNNFILHSLRRLFKDPNVKDIYGQMIKLLEITIEDISTFVCKSDEFDGIRDPQDLRRRKLMEPISLVFKTEDFLTYDSDRKHKTYKLTEIRIDPLRMRVSYLDTKFLLNTFSYNMTQTKEEYYMKMSKLKVTEAIPDLRQYSYGRIGKNAIYDESCIIEEEKLDDSINASFDMNIKETSAQGLISYPPEVKGQIGRSRIQGFSMSCMKVSNNSRTFTELWNRLPEDMEQLQKASFAFAQYKEKASIYSRSSFRRTFMRDNRDMNINSSLRESSTYISLHDRAWSLTDQISEEVTVNMPRQFHSKISNFGGSSGVHTPSVSNVVDLNANPGIFDRLTDKTNLICKEIQIVSDYIYNIYIGYNKRCRTNILSPSKYPNRRDNIRRNSNR